MSFNTNTVRKIAKPRNLLIAALSLGLIHILIVAFSLVLIMILGW